MKEMLRVAAAMGYRVHGAHLDPGVLGELYEAEREIYFDLGMSPDEQRFTVGHELGHAHHGHRCEDDPKAEDQADAFAARLLIDPAVYARLEAEGLHQHDIAEHFGVTVHALNLWMQRCLVKLRGVTYTSARMGAGQWTHRQVIAS